VTSQTNPLTAGGLHALCSGGNIGLEVSKGTELCGDDGAEHLYAFGIEQLVSQQGLVVLCRGCRWFR
jgi:hypothetical protein